MNNLFLFEHGLLQDRVAFTQLLESRLDFIKSKLNHLHDTTVDHIADAIDPTKNKKYTEWLVSRKLRGDWHPDENKIRSSLSDFDRAKSDVHDTNIKNHSIASMMNTAHLVRTAQPPKFSQLNKIFDDNGAVGFQVPDKQTSIHFYGPASKHPTNWCTAAAGNRNMFDGYEGGKYTLHLPNEHFLQLHHQSHQLKDPQNQEINPHDDSRYSGHLPTIEKFMRQTGGVEDHKKLTEKHFGIPYDEFNSSLNDIIKNDRVQDLYRLAPNIVHHPITDEQMDYLNDNFNTDNVHKNPHLTHTQVDKLLHEELWKSNPNRLENLAKNPALKDPEHVDRVFSLLKDTDSAAIGQMRHLTDKHIDEIVSKGDKSLESLARSRKLSDNHTLKLLKTSPYFFAQQVTNFGVSEPLRKRFIGVLNDHPTHRLANKFAEHNHITPEEMDDYLEKTKNSGDQHILLDNKSLQPHHADKIVENTLNGNPTILQFTGVPEMVHYKKINDSHIDKLLGSEFFKPDKGTLEAYLNKSNATTAMADRLHDAAELDMSPTGLNTLGYHRLKDYNPELLKSSFHAKQYAKDLNYQPKMKAEHLSMLLKGLSKGFSQHHDLPSDESINNILNHPNLNVGHVKQLRDDWGVDEHYNNLINSHPRVAGLVKE